jgi:hypothetical protein
LKISSTPRLVFDGSFEAERTERRVMMWNH